jgi:N4-gp56 family major capsid protein
MSKYSISTSNVLAGQIWEEELLKEMQIEEFFAPLSGKDNIVEEKNELEKKKGDRVNFGFTSRLNGAGVTNDQPLEDNEERMVDYSDTVYLNLYRHAVRDEGEMHRQRPVFNVTETQRALLKTWGIEKIEELKFAAAFGAFQTTVYNVSNVLTVAGSEAAARTAMNASNCKLTPQFLSQLRRYAMQGGTLSGVGAGATRAFDPLEPVKINGKKYLVLLVSSEVTYDMQYDTTFYNATKDARERGIDNPLFKIADIIWDGVIVIGHERVATFDNGGGASVHYSRAVLMGKQAICWAWGSRVKMVEKSFDYEDEIGVALKFIAGCKKPSKNSKDYGSIGVFLASTKIG